MKKSLTRRIFLRGSGGAVLGLPVLESLKPRSAWAQQSQRPRFAVFVRQANGVAQARDGEPERFWPRDLGPVTSDSLATKDSDRAVSELASYASKLLIVSGLSYPFDGNGCGHTGGGNQCLTAARVSSSPSGNKSLAMGESVDNRIARQLNPQGREPLTLYSGAPDGYIQEVLSYRGPMDLRAAEFNPFNAYSRMTQLNGADTETQQQVSSARISVNDLVRERLNALISKPQLSSEDRSRLQLHLESVRDLEVKLACILTEDKVRAMEELSDSRNYRSNDFMESIAKLHHQVISLGFACGYTHAATLQMGCGQDRTQYVINGERQPSFHWVSHRNLSDGYDGGQIPDAQLKHHEIDRIHARLFKHLLDRLSEHGVLDDSVAVWTNDLAHGPSHSYRNIPYVMAGSAGGYLKTGRYVSASSNGTVAHNRLFNTLLNAVGCTKEDGSPVDDFGDPSLEKGELSALRG